MRDGGIVGGIVVAVCAVTGAGGIVGAAFAAGEYYHLPIQESTSSRSKISRPLKVVNPRTVAGTKQLMSEKASDA